jgi:hypothetical protein
VVIVYFTDNKNYDAVLYGYGFREHWSWFNGMKTASGYVSFIIWKDFNCAYWFAINPAGTGYRASSFYSKNITAISTAVSAGKSSRDLGDIWLAAQDIQAQVFTVNVIPPFREKYTISVIAAQSSHSTFFGKFCVQNLPSWAVSET